MFPPPITRPTPAPILTMSATSVARRSRIVKSKPPAFCPARASPDSLSRTRLYFRSGNDQNLKGAFMIGTASLAPATEQAGGVSSRDLSFLVYYAPTLLRCFRTQAVAQNAIEISPGVVN